MENRVSGQVSSNMLLMTLKGDSEVIARLFILNGVDVNISDKTSSLPIHLAVKYRRTSMVELLLSYGADIDATDSAGTTP